MCLQPDKIKLDTVSNSCILQIKPKLLGNFTNTVEKKGKRNIVYSVISRRDQSREGPVATSRGLKRAHSYAG